MAAVQFNRESIKRVRRWIESYKRDISADIADIQDENNQGIVMKYDAEELETLSGISILLRSFEAVLTGIEKGDVK